MTDWQQATVQANGIAIHYYRTGGHKPALILAHGLTDNGLCWTPVAHALEADFDLILYDARGHGLSQAPAAGYAYTTLADDLEALVRALDLTSPIVMGHSMGAGTAALAAAKYEGLARAIVLEDPPWRETLPVGGEERRVQAGQWRDRLLANKALTREALMAKCRLEAPTWSDAEIGPWADAKLQVSPQVTEIVTAVAPLWEETVSQIKCPTLLLRADVDKGALVSEATAQRARALCRHLRDVHIAGAGHSIRREQFGAYMAAVRAFLEEL